MPRRSLPLLAVIAAGAVAGCGSSSSSTTSERIGCQLELDFYRQLRLEFWK